MIPSRASAQPAFAELRRALVRRWWSAIETRLRIEIALIALLAGGFVFWQSRVSLASIAHDHGALSAALRALAMWSGVALAGGALAASRLARQLADKPQGPAWLALPIAPDAVLRHLAWDARVRASWVAAGAPPILAALAGLVPLWGLAVLAILFAAMLEVSTRLGVRAPLLFAHTRSRAPLLDPITAHLVVRDREAPRARHRRSRPWKRAPRWRALWEKDVLLARRPASARRAVMPLSIAALSMAIWWAPLEPAAARMIAFGLALIASHAWGEWLIVLAARDPFAILRALPVRLYHVWIARACWGVIAVLALAIGHLMSLRVLSFSALGLFLAWTSAATMLLSVLAVHYGITLYPDERAAQRVYSLTLGIAIAASLMIPLMGWVTLLAALIHSARRLPRWTRLDPTT